jgi:hypothetical protein
MMRKIRYLALLAGLAAAAAIVTAPDAMAADALSSCVHTGTATVCEGQLSTSPQGANFLSPRVPYWESGRH